MPAGDGRMKDSGGAEELGGGGERKRQEGGVNVIYV
jgi:hypothetical protein